MQKLAFACISKLMHSGLALVKKLQKTSTAICRTYNLLSFICKVYLFPPGLWTWREYFCL